MFFFLPTGSNAQTSRRPVVTIAVAVTCTLLFLWTGVFEARPPDRFAFAEAEAFAKEHPYLLEADDGEEDEDRPSPEVLAQERKVFDAMVLRAVERTGGWERKLSLVPSRGFAQVGWLTNLFVHFDLMHLGGNLLFLWLVGPLLEEAWGRRRFLAFYLSAGLVASLVQFLISRGAHSSIGGASGAIAGCMGAFSLRFAMTRIRFHYFIWFFRIVMGHVMVPAWACGVLWFGRELIDLKGGGAAGVATGAHVGGFVLGGLVALSMRALGSEKQFQTVAEADDEMARRHGLFADAAAAMARGDLELARESLVTLQREAPDFPGVSLMMAELDVLSGRGVARLERVLRPLLTSDENQARAILGRLWSSIDARAFSPSFAWQLAERVDDQGHRQALLEAVAASTGALAIKARALLTPAAPPPPAPEPVRVLPVALISARREGLDVSIQGTARLVPFSSIEAVHGGIVDRALWVDLVVRQGGPRTALRLSGADPVVPRLFAGRPVPQAWQEFIAATRRAASVQPGAAPWAEFPSIDALTASWSGATS